MLRLPSLTPLYITLTMILYENMKPFEYVLLIGVARWGQRGHAPHKIFENIVILFFERRFSKQNSVIRLKSNILHPPIFGLATPLVLLHPICVLFHLMCA